MAETPNKTAVTRRDVVKIASAGIGTAGIGTAGIGTAGLAGIAAPPAAAAPAHWDPAHWDMEADVVILGYGGAGACAAIEAHDAGAKVLILEKQAEASHVSNTRMAAGAVYAADPTGDVAALKLYAEATQSGDNLPSMLEGEQGDLGAAIAAVWAKYEPQNIAFLQSLDPDFKTIPAGPAAFPNFPGHAAAKDRGFFSTYTGKVDFMNPTRNKPKSEKMMGEALWACMATGVGKRKNIRIVYEAPAKELITNGHREIAGVTAEYKGKPIRVRARRAVIIATGGYEFSKTMRQAFLDGPAGEGWCFYGSPANTGDGIEMALRVGAGLLKAGAIAGGLIPAVPIRSNGLRLGTGIGSIGTPNSLVVDNIGKRYFDESEAGSATYIYYREAVKFDVKSAGYPNIPSWLIFDETLRKRAPMATMAFGTVGYGMVPWSADNLDAVNRGWILKADTLDELGAMIQAQKDNRKEMDVAALKATVARFNDFCGKGADEDFGRKLQATATIATPPFYALALYAGGSNTNGGLYVSAEREVLDWQGRPIPHLFAAGEIASIFKFVGSGHLSECIVFGRVAGRNAAAQKVSA